MNDYPDSFLKHVSTTKKLTFAEEEQLSINMNLQGKRMAPINNLKSHGATIAVPKPQVNTGGVFSLFARKAKVEEDVQMLSPISPEKDLDQPRELIASNRNLNIVSSIPEAPALPIFMTDTNGKFPLGIQFKTLKNSKCLISAPPRARMFIDSYDGSPPVELLTTDFMEVFRY